LEGKQIWLTCLSPTPKEQVQVSEMHCGVVLVIVSVYITPNCIPKECLTTLGKAEHTNISSNISVITVLILFELQNLDAILRLRECGFYERIE
jgi:hypothetical protein